MSMAVAIYRPTPVNAVEMQITAEIKTHYLLGDTFSVPDATVLYDGETYQVNNGVVIMPDGNAYAKGEYTLDQLGKHSVKYSFTTDAGKTVVANKDFMVERQVFGVTSTLSTFEYVEQCPRYPGMEEFSAPWKVVNGNDYANAVLPEAITVKIAEGETFSVYKPMMMNADTMTKLLQLYTPQCVGNYVAERFVVRATDCYDENNYIEIVIEYEGSYHEVRANPAGALSAWMFKGESSRAAASTYIDGVKYSIRNDNYGPCIDSNRGRVRDVSVGFDVSNGYAYWQNYLDVWGSIVDLSNVDFFGSNAFKGFTTGEVFISVRGQNYALSQPAEFSVIEIAGLSGEQLKQSNYVDNQAPIINIDYQPTDENGVYIVKNKEFKVFDATATDINILGDVKASVYFSASNYDISVPLINNKFVPDKIGTYKIVYKAEDKFGNVGVKDCILTCIETENGQSLKLDKGGLLSNVSAGVLTTIPQATAIGINGNEVLNITLVESDGTFKTVKGGDELIFDKTGKTKLIFNYSDKYNSYTEEYEFDVVSSNIIQFISEPVLPRSIIAGKLFSLDNLYAYDYSGEKATAHPANVSVSFDGGEFTAVDPAQISVPENVSKAKFKFEYGSAQSIITEEIPVVNTKKAGAIDMTSYFTGNYTATASSSNILFTSNTDYGTNRLSYVGKMLMNNFEIKFRIPADYDDFTAINFIFTDYYDRDKQVVVTLKNVKDEMFLDINGKGDHSVRNFFSSKEVSSSLTLSYNPIFKCFNILNVGNFSFEHGFESGYCLLDIELSGINGFAGIYLEKLLNQGLGSVGSDRNGPVISYVSEKNTANISEVFTIDKAYVVDVLTPVLDSALTLTVQRPDGSNAVSTDGITLKNAVDTNRTYDIVLDVAGDYKILYNAVDQNGRKADAGYLLLKVKGDTVAPEISILNNKSLKSVSMGVGGMHNISVDVNDNYTDKKNLVVLISILGNNQNNFVFYQRSYFNRNVADDWESASAKITEKGNYTVLIQAYDEVGNISTVSYKLIVK